MTPSRLERIKTVLTSSVFSAILFTDEQIYGYLGGNVLRASDFTAIENCIIFKGLSAEEMHDILSDGSITQSSYKKHDDIFTPDSFTQSLAILTKGKADVCKQTDKGELFLSILTPGGVFGMAALFYEKDGFINTVRAREDCRVCFIPKKTLESVFIKYPAVANNYITVLSHKIHYLNSKISFLTSPSPSARLMNYLDSLDETGSGEITLPMSYSELSRVLSLGRTSLYNALDELSSSGQIIRDGKKIRILSPKGNE